MEENKHLEDLKEIRKMMENSSKFLSLSGLSGVIIGVFALIGIGVAWKLISNFQSKIIHYSITNKLAEKQLELDLYLFITAISVLILALVFGFLFTYLKAKKKGYKLNSPISYKLFWSLVIPLALGGFFTISLYFQGYYFLLIPAMLIFYGFSLLNGSKYVQSDIKYLGYSEIILGVLASYFYLYGHFFWAFGFGFLHIFYGLIMYFKYDKK